MLDSILTGDGGTGVDWMHVQKSLSRFFTRFLNILIPLIAFLGPFSVLDIGYSSGIVRTIVLFGLVLVAWLAWFARGVVAQQVIRWQRSSIGWGSVLLLVIPIIATFTSARPGEIVAIDGSFNSYGIYAWMAAVGYALLVAQQVRGRSKRLQFLAATYLFSSTLVAIIVSVWSFVSRSPIAIMSSIPVQALWFAVSLVLIIVFSSTVKKSTRLFWTVSGVFHLIALTLYDYAPAWYIVLGGAACFVCVLLLRSVPRPRSLHKESVPIRTLIGIIAIGWSILFLAVPVGLFAPFGFNAAAFQAVPVKTALLKLEQNRGIKPVLFGYGPGAGIDAFWDSTELVDMRAVVQFPNFGSGFSTVLWNGGMLSLVALLFIVFGVGARARQFLSARVVRRRIDMQNSDSVLAFGLSIAFIAGVAAFVFSPEDGYMLFTALFISALASSSLLSVRVGEKAAEVDPRHARLWQLSERSFGLPLARFLLLGGLILLVLFVTVVVWNMRGRMLFLSSVSVDASGTSVDVRKLDQVIQSNPRSYVYRTARIDFYQQSIKQQLDAMLGQSAGNDAILKVLEPSILLIDGDYAAFAERKLSPRVDWQLGWNAEQLANSLSAFLGASDTENNEALAPGHWSDIAEAYYEKALAGFPRNMILFTDVARFYHSRADILRKSGAQDAAVLASQYLARARALAGRALAVDNTYAPARLEQSQLLRTEGDIQGALDAIRDLTGQDAAIAYEASRLSTGLGSNEEARTFLLKAIELNPNHLQARYDLVRLYIAGGQTDEAKAALSELSSRVPEDDAGSRGLVQGLRKALEE